MVTTALAIQALYPTAIALKDYIVEAPGTIVFWDDTALGPQPSQATLDAVTQAQVDALYLARQRGRILDALQDAQDVNASRDKAISLTLLDAYTLLAGRINSLLTAIDNAATLPNLKTAVAAINDCPAFTGADLLQLLRDHVNAGEVD